MILHSSIPLNKCPGQIISGKRDKSMHPNRKAKDRSIQIIEYALELLENSNSSSSHEFRAKQNLSFPMKLKMLLDAQDNRGTTPDHNFENLRAMQWSVDGNSFVVLDEERFVRETLPFSFLEFGSNNRYSFSEITAQQVSTTKLSHVTTFDAFHEQLYLWGFKIRHVKEPITHNTQMNIIEYHQYSHPSLSRGLSYRN